MVVRNAALRMNSLAVGGWHDVLDAERLRMEIVEAFMAVYLGQRYAAEEEKSRKFSESSERQKVSWSEMSPARSIGFPFADDSGMRCPH